MGDELIFEVAKSLHDVGFANGVSDRQLHPIADAVVNMLRDARISDQQIRAALVDPEDD